MIIAFLCLLQFCSRNIAIYEYCNALSLVCNIGFKYRAPDGVLVGKMLFLTQILWVQVWMLVLGKNHPIFRFPYSFLKIKFQVNSASSKSNEYLPTFRFPYSFWQIKILVNSAGSRSNEYLPTFRFPHSFPASLCSHASITKRMLPLSL